MPGDNDLAEQIGEAIGAINILSAKIATVQEQTEEQHDYGRKNRVLIRRQNILIVAVALLSILAGSNFVRSRSVCEASNKNNRTNRTLWTYVLTLPPFQQLTPQEALARDAQVANFRTYINTQFAPQNCHFLPVSGDTIAIVLGAAVLVATLYGVAWRRKRAVARPDPYPPDG